MNGVKGAATITLDANKDNTLYDDFEDSLSNGAGEHYFVGRDAGGNLKRGVIAFDFDTAGDIPASSKTMA